MINARWQPAKHAPGFITDCTFAIKLFSLLISLGSIVSFSDENTSLVNVLSSKVSKVSKLSNGSTLEQEQFV